MPDFECTLWPDSWFGYSLTDCCIAHDLGGTDLELFNCIVSIHPALSAVGLVMLVGLFLFRPLYRRLKLNKEPRC